MMIKVITIYYKDDNNIVSHMKYIPLQACRGMYWGFLTSLRLYPLCFMRSVNTGLSLPNVFKEVQRLLWYMPKYPI